MKTITKAGIFILLKVVEIGTIIFLPHYLGRFGCFLGYARDGAPYWLLGVFFLLIAILLGLVIAVLIAANYHLTQIIYRKLKGA